MFVTAVSILAPARAVSFLWGIAARRPKGFYALWHVQCMAGLKDARAFTTCGAYILNMTLEVLEVASS